MSQELRNGTSWRSSQAMLYVAAMRSVASERKAARSSADSQEADLLESEGSPRFRNRRRAKLPSCAVEPGVLQRNGR